MIELIQKQYLHKFILQTAQLMKKEYVTQQKHNYNYNNLKNK